MRWMLVAMIAVACSDADDGVSPRIDLLAPPQGEVGDTIEILGERFCSAVINPPPADVPDAGAPLPDGGPLPDAGPPPPDAGPAADAGGGGGGPNPCANGFVTFGDEPGLGIFDVEDWTETRITVRVPNMRPGPTGIVVTVNGRQSKVADFEVIE